MDDLNSIATPSAIVCPECGGGGLYEINEARRRVFAATPGTPTLRSLEYAMNETTEDAVGGSRPPGAGGRDQKNCQNTW
jgi:hypothetical protein